MRSLCTASSLGRGVLRAIFIIPWVISAVAASYIWKWIYHSDFGVIGAVLVALGLTDRPTNLIDSVGSVLPSLIVVNVWSEFPFAMIMLMAGPADGARSAAPRRAGRRANTWQRFWHVTFPHLKGVSIVTVLSACWSRTSTPSSFLGMTGGGPSNASDIWITHIYELAFGRQRWGMASAYSVLLFLILIDAGYFYVRALSGSEKKERGL